MPLRRRGFFGFYAGHFAERRKMQYDSSAKPKKLFSRAVRGEALIKSSPAVYFFGLSILRRRRDVLSGDNLERVV